jgi:hypothetical protein
MFLFAPSSPESWAWAVPHSVGTGYHLHLLLVLSRSSTRSSSVMVSYSPTFTRSETVDRQDGQVGPGVALMTSSLVEMPPLKAKGLQTQSSLVLILSWTITYRKHASQKKPTRSTTNITWGLGCSSVVQHLPSMYETLGSIPAPKKKRQINKQKITCNHSKVNLNRDQKE